MALVTLRYYYHPATDLLVAVGASIWAMRAWISGNNVRRIKSLHDKYGSVVRVSPNQLSFCSAAAWKDIYGHVPGRKTFRKGAFYDGQPGQVRNLVSVSDPTEHALMRKMLSHGFSASALAAQENLIQHHVDVLVRQLRLLRGEAVNAVKWYNLATFDIVGELSFGQPFGALEAGNAKEPLHLGDTGLLSLIISIGEPHHWMKTFFASMKALTFVRTFEFLPPPLRSLCRRLWRMKRWSSNAVNASTKQAEYSRKQILRRLQQTPSRADFLTKLIAEREKYNTSMQQLTAQAGMLVRAGSETTSTSLSALTFYLSRTPRVYNKLVKEIRGAFGSYEQINGHSVGALNYLSAVIEEGLRLFPPFAIGLPRVSPGETVDGHFIPPGAVVYVSSWAASHSEANLHQPEDFVPERWINPECRDAKSASQPFSLGARGCLGRNLAMVDMRLILAKILWTFDTKMADEELDWVAASRSFVTWEKAELKVHFIPREKT